MELAEYRKSGRTYIVGEIAQAHDGSIGILHSLVDAVAATGVDAIKFQVHIAEAESSRLEEFRVSFSSVDATRYDYWKRMELSFEQWTELKRKCDSLGVEFLATPFSNSAVDLLEKLGVRRYKVGSGDLTNPLLLERIARTGKEVILSTGLCSLDDLDAAVSLLTSQGNSYAILQCTTSYPTIADDVGLAWLGRLSERYDCPVGLSDHSGSIYPGIGAVALGASVLEAHVTFDRRMFGPDAKASLTIDEFSSLVEGIRFTEVARGLGPDKKIDKEKERLRIMFGKSLTVNRSLAVGHVLGFDDLEGTKPGNAGIPISEYQQVIGRVLSRDKAAWEFLTYDDLGI